MLFPIRSASRCRRAASASRRAGAALQWLADVHPFIIAGFGIQFTHFSADFQP
ncbi:hypothetical protein [Burkholderia sp. SIMBA_062]|uniref:hypothetical protein n=1 Tax=Burkholderia sp. SIMBA_062 TaxID=3085803 RepID=UPI00397DA070